jgi:hypothetical protein
VGLAKRRVEYENLDITVEATNIRRTCSSQQQNHQTDVYWKCSNLRDEEALGMILQAAGSVGYGGRTASGAVGVEVVGYADFLDVRIPSEFNSG